MKRSILVLSLFLISVLVISGCDKEKTIERSSFPEDLLGYKLVSFNIDTSCSNLFDTLHFDGTEVCTTTGRIKYSPHNEESNKEIHLIPTYITKGKEELLDSILSVSTYMGNRIYKLEQNELYWLSEEYDIFSIQEYTYIETEDEYDSVNYNPTDISIENQFVKYFLDKYPPLIE